MFDDPFFRRFFGGPQSKGTKSKKKVQNSLGSGVIVKSNGIIITNYHVIKGADEITIVLSDRREFDASIIGSDKRTDIAILQINNLKESLPSLSLRDSDDLEVGDLVLAIGNPFGVGQTVTSGIISALARTKVGINDLNFFIQTDAAINPGNSGGALVSLDGKLVGINSAIYSKGGGSVGIGFAIPTNMVQTVLTNLVSNGRVIRPWMGAQGQGVTSDIATSMDMRRPLGVLINRIYPNGPFDRAGIKIGDIVTEIDNHGVNDADSLRFRIITSPIGRRLKIKIIRQREKQSIDFIVEAPPETPKINKLEISNYNPLKGVIIGNLSPAVADQIGKDLFLTGVIILEIRQGSPAHQLGFRRYDIIKQLNGKEVSGVKQLQSLLSRKPDRWNIAINRDGAILSLRVKR
jgi:serine protease Do